MATEAKLKKFDKPIVFAISITLVVIGTLSVMSWAAVSLGLSGPLGALKGGVVQS
jgi:hypothetical protein